VACLHEGDHIKLYQGLVVVVLTENVVEAIEGMGDEGQVLLGAGVQKQLADIFGHFWLADLNLFVFWGRTHHTGQDLDYEALGLRVLGRMAKSGHVRKEIVKDPHLDSWVFLDQLQEQLVAELNWKGLHLVLSFLKEDLELFTHLVEEFLPHQLGLGVR